ncbi:MAG TPA: hypothetical protein VJV75_04020 [Candidatus Polarisedimenticolia bacterium]|nr:hypothetical protein [Candidatus Polarisedimenticolia bacterium]
MRRIPVSLCVAFILLLCVPGSAGAWSLRDEVTVTGSGLTAEVVWEIINAKTYCQNAPANLDRVMCTTVPDPGEFWFGLDAAGNSYGTVTATDAAGEYYDVHRRPAGTHLSQAILRITKRKEPVFGQVTKIQFALGSMIDQTSGTLLLALTGSCLSTLCNAQGDTTDHLALLRVTGLPTLFDLALTYQPPNGLALKIPTRAEALPTMDRVDFYYGPAPALGNLATATPLACNVAPGAQPGSVVTVVDPLPPPALGQARYYEAVVTSGAERRAGRRGTNGVMTGRVTTGLPACP